MGVVGVLGRQHQLGEGGHFDEPVFGALVDSVTRRPSPLPSETTMHSTSERKRADGLDEARLVVARNASGTLRPARVSARPWPTTIRRVSVSRRKMKVPARSSVGSALPARHRQAVPAAVAGAGGRQHHRIVAVATSGCRRAAPCAGSSDQAHVRVLLAPPRRCRVRRLRCLTVTTGMSRGAFSCSSSSAASITGSEWKRSRMRPFEDDVGDGHDRHALVMRHVVVDDGVVCALGHALRREVDGVVEAVVAERAEPLAGGRDFRPPLPA